VYRDGRKFEIGKIIFQIQRDAPRMTHLAIAIPTAHLSVDAIARSNSGLAIVEQSRTANGYIIFDLKRSNKGALAQPSKLHAYRRTAGGSDR
jgi:hypothetical protein